MRREVIIGILLIVSSGITEAHSILWHFNPILCSREYDFPFWSKPVGKISVEWCLIYVGDCLYKITLCICALLALRKPSRNIFWMFILQLIYNVFDYSMLLYNNKKGYLHYWLLWVLISTTIFLIVFPIHKQKSKIVNLWES